jgi:hypothetical protein
MVMHDSRTRECKTASACTPPFARFACSRSCYGQVSDVLKDDPFSLHPKGSSQKRLIDQKSAYHSDFIYSPNHRCVPDLPSLPKTSQQNRIGQMAQSIQPEMCICRENLEAKVVTLAFTIFHVERNPGLTMVPKAGRPSLSPHPLVPPPRRYGWLRTKTSTLTGQIADIARQPYLLQR